MDAGNTERLLLAERAAEWLVKLEADTPEAHNGFRHWLIESPQHVREALAATATRLLLTHLFHERDFDAHMLAARAGSVDEIHGDRQDTHVPQTEPSDAQRE